MKYSGLFIHLFGQQDARSGPHKLIADSIRRHPEHLFSTLQESFQKIFSGKYVYANVSWSYSQLCLLM